MIVEGEDMSGMLDDWVTRDRRRKMSRKNVYVDTIKVIEYRDESCEEFSTGPSYELKLQLDVKDFDKCVKLRKRLIELVGSFNEELD